MNPETEEITYHLQQLQAEFEDLAVGGLRTMGPEHLPLLQSLSEHFTQIGATHSGQCLHDLTNAIRNNDKGAAVALMRAQASLRLFERILTKEAISAELQSYIEADAEQ